MDELWKKEYNNGDTLFVDLLKTIQANYSHEAAKWDDYLSNLKSTMKDNQKSIELMRRADFNFQSGHFYLAMELNTKAISLAENNSKTMSQAFANRATCFFHMEMFDRALSDIQLALRVNCPSELTTQMKKLRVNCEKMLQTYANGSPERKPDFAANQQFPCLADVLAIKNNGEFGRHIVANCDIDVGQHVLMEESFASVAKSDDQMSCYTCLTEIGNFIACSNCCDVVFCSSKCMEVNVVHKFDCNTFYHQMHCKIQFTIRTMLLGISAFSSIDNLMACVENDLQDDKMPDSSNDVQSKYRMYFKLKRISLKPDVVFDVYKLFKSAMSMPSIEQLFDSLKKQRFLMHLILHHLAINVTNATENEFTASIGLVLSLFNHSCAPNLYNYSMDNQKFGVTIRPVKKGEQIFISYLGTGDDDDKRTAVQRQILLKSKWQFECKCDKCEPRCRSADSYKMKLDPCFKFVHRNFKSDPSDHMNTSVLKKKCIKFLSKYGHLPFSNELKFISDIYTKLILS